MKVEVVYAKQDASWTVFLDLDEGTQLREAVIRARTHEKFSSLPEDVIFASYAIWGKEVPEDTVLRDGDRIEILRPLVLGPMERRRVEATRSRD